MCSSKKMIDLGFSKEPVLQGTHLCLIFTSEDERIESLTKFILSGLKTGERTFCLSDKTTAEDLRAFLEQHQLSFDQFVAQSQLILTKAEESYVAGGTFSPERMLDALDQYYKESIKLGFSGARVMGEMVPSVEHVPGGDRLLEYECRVSMMLRDHPLTAVCQYDARDFDGATIMEVLKVHPEMVVDGSVVQNPFFIQPEKYLRGMTRDA